MSRIKIISVAPGGTIRLIHDDKMSGLMGQGDSTIRRASNVEPGDPTKGQIPTGWYADLNPSGHDVILGPFDRRQQALDAEVEWINAHILTHT